MPVSKGSFRSSHIYYLAPRCETANWLLTPRPEHKQSKSCCAQHQDREDDREWSSGHEESREGGEGSRGGDGEDPRPDDAASNAPSNGAESSGRAGTHDAPRYDVRCANRKSPRRCRLNDCGAHRLCGEPVDGLYLDDPPAHRPYDAPASRSRPQADR